MSPLELRHKLHAQIDRIPEVQLPQIQRYLTSFTHKPSTKSTGASLLVALQGMEKWQGDDFEDYPDRAPVNHCMLNK